MSVDRQEEFVLRTLEERDIRFVRLWFTDVLGYLKSVAVAPAELEGAFAEGIGFDGSAIEGFARVYEADMIAKPDPSTFQLMPLRDDTAGVGRMFCDILMPDGTPSYADPRHVLKRALARAAALGFTFYTHPEIEFFLLREKPEPGVRPRPIDSGGYFDHTPHSIAHDFRRDAIVMLERIGISVEFSHHEGAPGQQEIDLRYADALTHRRQHHDVPARDEGGRARAGRVRLLHAEAVHRVPGLGHAHPHVAVRGRPERLLRAGRRVPAVEARPGVHRRAAPARGRDHRGLQPVGELLQAAVGRHRADRRRRRRGARLHLLGAQQPVRPDPGADVQAAEGQRDQDRVPLASTRPATRTWRSR